MSYDIDGWMASEDSVVSEPANYVPPGETDERFASQTWENDAGPGLTMSWGSGSDYVDRVGGGQGFGGGSTMSMAGFSSSSGGSSGGGGTVSRSGGGGSFSYTPATPTGRTTTTSYLNTKALPTFSAPTFSAPTYTSPVYDQGRVNYLAQQQFAPMQTKLQNALYTGMGKVAATDNPYMQAQARKQLLSGYGGGLSEGAAASSRMGQQLYQPEYQGKLTEAQTNYQGQLASSQATFNAQMASAEALFKAAMMDWEKSGTATTTQRDTFDAPTTSANVTGGLYTPSDVNSYNPHYGKTYKSRDDYIASGDYMRNILTSGFSVR
jgi:hypothetical protein